jgi:hypothetical protein
MDRRKAIKMGAGVFTAGGAGLLSLPLIFRTDNSVRAESRKLEYDLGGGDWKYDYLDPEATAQFAYGHYKDGSCMYATVTSVVSQLADKFGGPYESFPCHMFKYGHGGVGGFGTVCGALNGAAALIGLLIPDKGIQDVMITDLFQWYEKEAMPVFVPAKPVYDAKIPVSVSNSVLCHASNTTWCKVTGFAVNSDERKERCRRLTGDVARQVTMALNNLAAHAYTAHEHTNEEVNSCIACHGDVGKVKNTSSKMSCNSCHSESIGHRIFSDVHYRYMKD